MALLQKRDPVSRPPRGICGRVKSVLCKLSNNPWILWHHITLTTMHIVIISGSSSDLNHKCGRNTRSCINGWSGTALNIVTYEWNWSGKMCDATHSQGRQINTRQSGFFFFKWMPICSHLTFGFSAVCLFSPTAVCFFKFNAKFDDFLSFCCHLKCCTNSSWQRRIDFAEKDASRETSRN